MNRDKYFAITVCLVLIFVFYIIFTMGFTTYAIYAMTPSFSSTKDANYWLKLIFFIVTMVSVFIFINLFVLFALFILNHKTKSSKFTNIAISLGGLFSLFLCLSVPFLAEKIFMKEVVEPDKTKRTVYYKYYDWVVGCNVAGFFVSILLITSTLFSEKFIEG